MSVSSNFSKTIGAIGSIGGVIGDTVDVFSASINEGKSRLVDEISSSNYEAKLENAKSKILAKASAIKEIMEKLNISASEAAKLLDEEMN